MRKAVKGLYVGSVSRFSAYIDRRTSLYSNRVSIFADTVAPFADFCSRADTKP